MSDIKIFVTHTPNRNTMRVDNALLYNVIAGSDFQNKPVPSKVLRDNEGETITGFVIIDDFFRLIVKKFRKLFGEQ